MRAGLSDCIMTGIPCYCETLVPALSFIQSRDTSGGDVIPFKTGGGIRKHDIQLVGTYSPIDMTGHLCNLSVTQGRVTV